MFVVRPGIYHIPNFGKLDTRKKVSNAQYLALYENKDFPFITISEEVIPFLKRKNYQKKDL